MTRPENRTLLGEDQASDQEKDRPWQIQAQESLQRQPVELSVSLSGEVPPDPFFSQPHAKSHRQPGGQECQGSRLGHRRNDTCG